MQRLHYDIKGMSCAACVSHVERAIASVLDEKDTFTVSLLTNSVSIIPAKELNSREQIEALEISLVRAVRAAGYTLLTEAPEKEARDNGFQKNLIRLIFSAILTLGLMYLSMGGMLGLPIPPFLVGVENALFMALAQLSLTLPVILLNFKFFKNGFSALWHRAPNMDSLIAVGSGAALIYGLFAILMIALAKDDHAQIHSWLHDLYFESSAMILTLVSFGKMLESRAKDKASDAVRSLATLAPKFSVVIRDGKEISIPTKEVRVGDLLLIRAGELIPVDGEVVQGSGSCDESALTGESMPVEKESGDSVRAACVLTTGALTVRATGVGEDTSLSRIIRLLEDAAASKAPIARIADRVSAVFVPAVMGISLLTLILWLLFSHNAERALRSAISVLVISCPCALGLATPTAITVGIGRAARSGILFRNAQALEKLCSVKTAVFDKTGTVTEGRPALGAIYAQGVTPTDALRYAASVERFSSHPLALAVQNAAQERGLELLQVDDFESLVGFGAQGRIQGDLYCVGKPDARMREQINAVQNTRDLIPKPNEFGTDILILEDRMRLFQAFLSLEQDGKTAVLITKNQEPIGVLGISDRIRSDSAAAVDALKSVGVTCLMMTGDNERTAAFVANQANLDGYFAGLTPEDKERMVRELSSKSPTLMVGDGINDSPALVRADVGIAIGAGTEVAIDCAEVVLSGSSLMSVYEAFSISRATIRVIKQNLFWALFYNAICIPVAAGLFSPLWGWQLSPMLASAAMSLSSVFVVLNALRLRKVRLYPKHWKDVSQKTATGCAVTDCSVSEDQDQNLKGDTQDMLFKSDVKTFVLQVEGMMCPRCVAHVKEALEAVKGVKTVEVSLEEKRATVTATLKHDEALKKAVTDAGYEVVEA